MSLQPVPISRILWLTLAIAFLGCSSDSENASNNESLTDATSSPVDSHGEDVVEPEEEDLKPQGISDVFDRFMENWRE